jgi:hypothetical protein
MASNNGLEVIKMAKWNNTTLALTDEEYEEVKEMRKKKITTVSIFRRGLEYTKAEIEYAKAKKTRTV